MSSSSTKAAAGAMGSKAARACDGCLRRRARWYCAADDAFLCQGCDTSVHSANPLARRHERVRLRPTSPTLPPQAGTARARRGGDEDVPAWPKRKARTPRSHAKSVRQLLSRRLVVVPDAAGGDSSPEEHKSEGEIVQEEEELLYRVPVFDPVLAEFCSPPPPLEDAAAPAASSCCNEDGSSAVESPETMKPDATTPVQFFPESLAGFGPTDAELMEFAADMEALLGRGLDEGNDEDSFCMETLGLIKPTMEADGGRVKLEADAMLACGGLELQDAEVSGEIMLDIDFDYGSPQATTPDDNAASSGAQFLRTSLALNLNYEAIMESWASSPWADGKRPHVKLDDCWPHGGYFDVQGAWMVGGGVVAHGADGVGIIPRLGLDGGAREARVTRYREKRRNRLFSKKIRYEVRKLNAEKRPRMKGRFVKRTNAGGAAVATPCVA